MAFSKYKNKITIIDGIKFRSIREGNRWLELKLLEKAGEISDLKRQVIYRFVHNGIKLGWYAADFVYNEKGKQIVEDSKGCRTPAYKKNKKMMLAFFGISIKET